MAEAVQIRSLPKRAFKAGDPKWTRRAIATHEKAGIDSSRPYYLNMSEFGRSWEAMRVLRERCLPQLLGRKPLKVLEVGIGDEPHCELFELFDHLMKSGVKFHLAALDANAGFLDNVKAIKEGYAERYDEFPLPRNYYRTFLGRPWASEYVWSFHMNIPTQVRKRIELIHGDIAADRLTASTYDVIVCMNVLKYLKSGLAQALAVHNMAEGLKKGGFLLTDRIICDDNWWSEFIGGKLNGRWGWFNERSLARLGFGDIHQIPPPSPLQGKEIADIYKQYALQRV